MRHGMARPFKWACVVVFSALSTVAFSAPCDPDRNTWTPSRYYPPGKTVFHKGDWYESRQLHEGKTPGSDFEWKKLATAPECHADNDRAENGQKKPQERDSRSKKSEVSGQARGKPEQSCKEPGQWSFGASYTVGEVAVHKGETYRAIRPSNGQMPGMSQPPHWEPVDHPCKNRPDNGN